MQILSPDNVIKLGLQYINVQPKKTCSRRKKEEHFQKFFDASSSTLAEQWYDLTMTDIPDARLEDHEKTLKGFRKFLIAHNFLWEYHKNATCLAGRWGQCEHNSHGKPVWDWVKKIAALKAKKIVWPNCFNQMTVRFLSLLSTVLTFAPVRSQVKWWTMTRSIILKSSTVWAQVRDCHVHLQAQVCVVEWTFSLWQPWWEHFPPWRAFSENAVWKTGNCRWYLWGQSPAFNPKLQRTKTSLTVQKPGMSKAWNFQWSA